MPCHAAIDSNAVFFQQDVTVEKALKDMKKAKVNVAAVVDEDKKIVGFVSAKTILKSLIPVSVAMADGLKIDMRVTAAPGVAKRLRNTLPLQLHEIMNRKPRTIKTDQPLWEGLGLIVQEGSPLCVIDDRDQYFGLITYDSLLKHLTEVEIS